MVLADTNKVGLYYNMETLWGETPSTPDMLQVRYTGESLAYNKVTVTSETIRDDRMRDQVALVGFNTEGDVNYELSFFSFDDFIEAALAGTWTNTHVVTATTISVASGTSSYDDSGNGFGNIAVGSYIYPVGFTNPENNRRAKVTAVAAGSITVDNPDLVTEASGTSRTINATGYQAAAGDVDASAPSSYTSTTTDFTTLGLSVGQRIRVTGFVNAANNGIFEIASIAANQLDVVETTLVNETAGSTDVASFYGRMLRNGTVQRSAHIEKRFTDVTQFQSFQGMRVGTMSWALSAQEIITGSFSFMGKTATLAQTSVAGSNVTANPTSVLTASANVGSIEKDDVTLTSALRSISIDLENNLRFQNVVGQLAAAGIGYGFLDITGTVEAYFEDEVLFDDLVTHATLELSWQMTDDDGNVYSVELPKVYFTTGNPTAGGGNDDVIVPLEYAAVRDTTRNAMIQIDSLANPA